MRIINSIKVGTRSARDKGRASKQETLECAYVNVL